MRIDHKILNKKPEYIHVKQFDLINYTEYQYSGYDVLTKGVVYIARFKIKYKK